MKKNIKSILICFSILAGAIGCSRPEQSGIIHYSDFSCEQQAVVGECEYIVTRTYGGPIVYTHKGSCTSCWNRMQNMINEAVLERKKLEKTDKE